MRLFLAKREASETGEGGGAAPITRSGNLFCKEIFLLNVGRGREGGAGGVALRRTRIVEARGIASTAAIAAPKDYLDHVRALHEHLDLPVAYVSDTVVIGRLARVLDRGDDWPRLERTHGARSDSSPDSKRGTGRILHLVSGHDPKRRCTCGLFEKILHGIASGFAALKRLGHKVWHGGGSERVVFTSFENEASSLKPNR